MTCSLISYHLLGQQFALIQYLNNYPKDDIIFLKTAFHKNGKIQFERHDIERRLGVLKQKIGDQWYVYRSKFFNFCK